MWDNLEAWKWIGVTSLVMVAVMIGLRAVTEKTLEDTLHPVDEDDEDEPST